MENNYSMECLKKDGEKISFEIDKTDKASEFYRAFAEHTKEITEFLPDGELSVCIKNPDGDVVLDADVLMDSNGYNSFRTIDK